MPQSGEYGACFHDGHEIGWNRGSGQLECSEPFRHLLWRGRRRIEMTSAASAMMLLTTELMAVTMSRPFHAHLLSVDITIITKYVK